MRGFVTVVSGLPRSGTSLMMQALEAGGLPPLADAARPPDAGNPRGYYELAAARRLGAGSGPPPDWVDAARGRAVKVIHALLPRLPGGRAYRVVWMERALPEVVASQAALLELRGERPPALSEARLEAVLAAQAEEALAHARAHPDLHLLRVEHAALLREPERVCAEVARFVGPGLDPARMAGAVDPALHRVRRGPAPPAGGFALRRPSGAAPGRYNRRP